MTIAFCKRKGKILVVENCPICGRSHSHTDSDSSAGILESKGFRKSHCTDDNDDYLLLLVNDLPKGNLADFKKPKKEGDENRR